MTTPDRRAPREVRWTTIAVAAAWIASAAFAVGLYALAPGIAVPAPQAVLVIVVALVPLVLGAVVARGAPGNAVGPLLALSGLVATATNLVQGDRLGPLAGSWTLLYLTFAILLLVVPDGRTAGRRWSAAGWAITGVSVAFILVCALQWAIPATAGPTTVPAVALLPVLLGLLVCCAAAPVVRYRRAGEADRLRLRWVFLVGVSLPLTLLLCWASYLVLGTADLVGYGLVLMYVAIPAGAAIALLRPGVLDIDRATLAAVTATVLASAVLAVLSVMCALAGLALSRWDPVAAVATTAALTAAAVAAYPFLRRALERALYPEQGRAVRALAQLAAAVDAGADTPASVQAVLRTALRDPGLVVALRGLADRRLRALDGGPAVPGPTTATVRARGQEIGAIIPSSGRLRRPGTTAARAAAPLIDAARTDAEIAHARAEVEASRERILLAGYEERRRLERDLHDGAQQRLVALGMRLRVLQRAAPGPAGMTDALDGAVAELATAVAELRQIAHGVRPSALDDGLDRALAELARRAPSTVELDVDAPDLSDAVATTAYFVVSEAVANALRHADAAGIRVTVRADDGHLSVRVVDDGRGGATVGGTGGLAGLADRVAALGGVLEVASRAGHGTVLEARLPCGS